MDSLENTQIKVENESTNDALFNKESSPDSPPLLYLKPKTKVPEFDPTACLISKTGLRPDYDKYVKPYIDNEDKIPWTGDYSSWLQNTPGVHRVPETSRVLHDLLYHNPALNVEIKPINKYRLGNIFTFDQGILNEPFSRKPMDIRNWVDEKYLQKFNDIHTPKRPKEEMPRMKQSTPTEREPNVDERRSRTPVDPSIRSSSQHRSQRPPSSDVVELKQRSSSQQVPRHTGSSNQLAPSQEHRSHSSQGTREDMERSRHSRHPEEHLRPKHRQVEDSNAPPAIKRSSSRSRRSEAGSPKVAIEDGQPRAHRDESSKHKDRTKDPSRQRPESQSSSRHKEHHRSHKEGEHHSKSIPVTSSTTPIDPNRSHHRHAHSGSGTPSRHPENPDSSARRRDPEHASSSKHSREHHEHHRSKRQLDENGQPLPQQRQESKSSSKHRTMDEREYREAKKSRSGHATPDTTSTHHSSQQHQHRDPEKHRSSSSKQHSEHHQSSKHSRPRDPNDPRAHRQHKYEGASEERRHRDPHSSSSRH